MTYRVLQWGTGAVGREALRGILDRSDLTLAGVKVYTDAKAGLDAGELIGRADVGVRAALNVEDLLAEADCVLYTPRTPSVDEVCRLLSAGVNVVTTSFAFHPARMDAVDRDRLLSACRTGGTSLHGTGLNPGNLGVIVPLALSGMCREIERVTVQERADWSMYDSVDITFDQMRFGAPPDEVTEQVESLRFTSDLFRQQVWLLGDTLGADLDEVVTDLEVIPASADRDVFGRTLQAGTVAGQRWRWSGRSAGATRVEVETLWTVAERQPAHWPTPQHGWTITIEGTPSVRTHVMTLASFVRDVPLAEHVQSASVATAMQAVNAVPGVCAAAAGFTTMADIPFVWHRP
ncbi:NAD(P)H-dependent amine dehydrogenase family protein [Mycolicibacterium confluentis]|uniref:Dihydrodipicolinate reductase n=1 Tax=Mycolicibacterium confluentis TaxID=28047 RepID=A0A7I7Y228_9MYCO|nr:dihydrodipicolinate reductase [Mycolicibacterium confluentis]MCV7320645.1 dihydrodipicolinate reductase [Mycolicibacterium confluentis]ORV30290.1 dihydrodipicolinate reductase [Mycolicibacterium confluentis]BBZ35688.1 dihydrodipicolinate reductase [Mycolicibacterium confluentis]